MADGYGMFGLSMARIRAYGVDLMPEEARAVLEECASISPPAVEYRPIAPSEYALAARTSTELYVRYEDEWWEVCREDLSGQVRTGRYDWPIDDAIASIVYGVRLIRDRNPKQFVILDSLTDG